MATAQWTSRIRFGFELATFLTAIAALFSIGLTYRQIGLAAYQQIISNSIEFDKVLVEHPELRPYFKDSKHIAKDDPSYNRAALIAELQLDVIDSIIAFPLGFAQATEKHTWANTFQRSFRESPIMCEFLQERREQYHDDTIQVAKTVCIVDKPW